MKERTIELWGFKIDVYTFGYASFYYPQFNPNAEFKASSKGFRELSRYLRTVNWLERTMPRPKYTYIDIKQLLNL